MGKGKSNTSWRGLILREGSGKGVVEIFDTCLLLFLFVYVAVVLVSNWIREGGKHVGVLVNFCPW